MILTSIPCTTLLYWTAAIVSSSAILFLASLRLYVFCTLGICKSKNRMDGKTIIITGCTSGIGKETARDLAKRGARIIMACRNTDTANQLKGFVTKITLYFILNKSSHDKNKTILIFVSCFLKVFIRMKKFVLIILLKSYVNLYRRKIYKIITYYNLQFIEFNSL